MKICAGIVESFDISSVDKQQLTTTNKTSETSNDSPRSTTTTTPGTKSPLYPSSSASSSSCHGISLTKDQALIILGMSSKVRTRIVDLDKRLVLENFRQKRRKTEERMTALTRLNSSSSSPSGVVSSSLEQQIQEVKWEQIKVHAAAQHLLNALRVLDLTKDFSWKPGVPVSSGEDSRWTILVKPKGRSVSLLRKKSTRNAEGAGRDKDGAVKDKDHTVVQ